MFFVTSAAPHWLRVSIFILPSWNLKLTKLRFRGRQTHGDTCPVASSRFSRNAVFPNFSDICRETCSTCLSTISNSLSIGIMLVHSMDSREIRCSFFDRNKYVHQLSTSETKGGKHLVLSFDTNGTDSRFSVANTLANFHQH